MPASIRPRHHTVLHRVHSTDVVGLAERLFHVAFRGTVNEAAACLYWTACTVFAASQLGARLIVQAGSASFLRLPKELDDRKETTHTHFSYAWQNPDDHRVAGYLANGILPEMHVWAADPARQEIVDLTTRFLPEQCLSCAGDPWLTPEPPKYLWVPISKLPFDWHYDPSERATRIAMTLMQNTAMREVRAAAEKYR